MKKKKIFTLLIISLLLFSVPVYYQGFRFTKNQIIENFERKALNPTFLDSKRVDKNVEVYQYRIENFSEQGLVNLSISRSLIGYRGELLFHNDNTPSYLRNYSYRKPLRKDMYRDYMAFQVDDTFDVSYLSYHVNEEGDLVSKITPGSKNSYGIYQSSINNEKILLSKDGKVVNVFPYMFEDGVSLITGPHRVQLDDLDFIVADFDSLANSIRLRDTNLDFDESKTVNLGSIIDLNYTDSGNNLLVQTVYDFIAYEESVIIFVTYMSYVNDQGKPGELVEKQSEEIFIIHEIEYESMVERLREEAKNLE